MEIGLRVRHLLVDKGMTQTALADVFGLHQSGISKKMHGRVAWSAAEVVAVAGALGVDPAALLPRQDSNLKPAGFGRSVLHPVDLPLDERRRRLRRWSDRVTHATPLPIAA